MRTPRDHQRILTLLCALAAGTAISRAEETRETSAAAAGASVGLPSDEELERRGAVIGRILYDREEIFDPGRPGEDRPLYRLANRLHRTTRARAVDGNLLFRAGEAYSARLLRESERRLRDSGYLYAASIRPIAYDGERVDVEVTTRDVWTLDFGIGLGRSGGTNRSHFKVRDANLLGTGKSLSLERLSDVDRTSTLVRYFDPALLGSHTEIDLAYGTSDDGGERSLSVVRPFYALDSRWSAGFSAAQAERVETLYELGGVKARIPHRRDRFEAATGWSSGLVGDRLVRWTSGVSFENDRFLDLEPTSGAPPADRRWVYPWLGFERRAERYEERRNLDQIQRVEDLALGYELRGRIGFAAAALGSTRNAIVFGFEGGGARELADETLLRLSGRLSGRWTDGPENLDAALTLHYQRRDFGRHQLFLAAELGAARRLDPDRQLLLGGDSGLRGYPLRYQEGDLRALVTVEQRWFTDFYPWRLVHVGAAAFVDLGRTWGGPPAAARGWLGDVGVGLRLGNSRSGHGAVVHLDLAVPLVRPDGIAGLQWLISTRKTF